MGLFDELAGKAMGMMSGTGGENSGLISGVLEAFGNGQLGGLPELVQKFQQNGLGEQVASWIGTGANLPINANQLQQVLGSDLVQSIATKAGIAPEEASSKMAEYLPSFIDKLTPDGTIPEGGLMAQGLGALKGMLG